MKVWLITGYDGLKECFEVRVRARAVRDISELLKRLASRHLSEREVIMSSVKECYQSYAPHLEVRPNLSGKRRVVMTTGSGYHYAASYEDYRVPTGPKGRNRPDDVIGDALRMATTVSSID